MPLRDDPVLQAVIALAARQGGAVGHEQLLRIGVPATRIDSWLRSGRLRHEHRGVYALGRPLRDQDGQAWAVVLAGGCGAALSHPLASCWHRLAPWSTAVPAHVTVPRRGGHAQPRIVVHRVRRLHDADVTTVRGLRCTTVERTLLDEAERLPLKELRRLVRQAAVTEQLDLPALDDLLGNRARGRRGQRKLRAVLADVRPETARTASDLEELLLRLCREGGLPTPGVNVLVRGRERRWRADAIWLTERVVVEVDSWRYHGFVEAFEDDHLKDEDLRAAGFDVLRFTARRLEQAPERVVEAIRRALDASANRPGSRWAS